MYIDILPGIRAERNRLASMSDGMILRAQELAARGMPSTVQAWLIYRQALRDLPAVVLADLSAGGSPETYIVPWPVPPIPWPTNALP